MLDPIRRTTKRRRVTLVERDRDSSLVTTWILSPTASGTATDLRLSTIWEGHGGVGGFFERTFAPRGLRRIHGELLDRLTGQLGARARRLSGA
jgi:hypothetical protein